jgi:hypothetical protein
MCVGLSEQNISSFFAGGRKKQNKFPSNLHCPFKKLNPFLF